MKNRAYFSLCERCPMRHDDEFLAEEHALYLRLLRDARRRPQPPAAARPEAAG
jgi:hypothetical protein